jgi:hypothetical protein
MWQRVDLARDDSDTALFYDLLFLGELAVKLTTSALISMLGEDRERQRYAIEHALVRANGIGDWATKVDEILTSPVSQLLTPSALAFKRELMQRWSPSDEAWQRSAVELLDQTSRRLQSAPESLPAKVSLQRWFQMFAGLRNRTRGHGAPTGLACSTMAGDLERSLRLLTDNLTLFQQPWAFLRRSLSGKYRVVMLNGAPDAFDHLKRESNHEMADGIYIALGAELLPVPFVYTDVDLTDFFVANGNFRLGHFEALSYLSNDSQEVDGSRYLLPASALPASGTTASPVLDLVGRTFTNLPPTIPDYVRRAELESAVEDLLTDDRHPIITLVGRGGVGKTSLALEVLHRLTGTGGFFAIVWFSARDIDLLPHGARRVRPDVLTQADIAAQFVELMNPAGSASKDFNDVEFLARSMSGSADDGPFVFVFDNFETVRNPIDIYTWIDTYIRIPNKVLITSRFRDFRGDYPVEVRGMTRDEFRELATSTATRIGIANLLSEGFLDRLYDESDGHPYVVKVLLGEAAVQKRAPSVERVMASRDDILDALFERTFSAISPAARRVFLTLCNWRSIVPRLAVEAALLRPANERIDVAQAFDVLERSSLIETVGGPELADQFIRVPLAAAVFGRRKLTVTAMKTAIDADTEIIRMFGAAKVDEAGRGLAPRLDRLVASVGARAQSGENIADDIAVLEFVARNYAPAWLRIADLFDEAPDAREGARQSIEALKHYLETNPDDFLAWRRLAETSVRANDALGELHARFQIAESPQAGLADVSLAANRFNSLAATGALDVDVDVDERRTMARRIRSLLEGYVRHADATTFSRLAWLSLHVNDLEAAGQYTQRGLALEPYNQHCRRLAERLDIDAEGSATPS